MTYSHYIWLYSDYMTIYMTISHSLWLSVNRTYRTSQSAVGQEGRGTHNQRCRQNPFCLLPNSTPPSLCSLLPAIFLSVPFRAWRAWAGNASWCWVWFRDLGLGGREWKRYSLASLFFRLYQERPEVLLRVSTIYLLQGNRVTLTITLLHRH